MVSFFENSDHSVVAHVQGKINGEWKKITVVPEDKILVAGQKLSSSIQKYNQSIDLEKRMEVIPDRKFTELSLEHKLELTTQLHPIGQYDLVVCYTYGDNPEFEADFSYRLF